MPKRTTGGTGKRVPMNMRTTQGLRKKINAAARRSGRSLVQEVEHRVERSFMRDEAHGEIERIRGHVLGMLNVTDGKVERLRREVVEMRTELQHDLRRQNETLLKLVQMLDGLPLQLRPQDRDLLRAMLDGVPHG
jgi:hypothetical protein